ncbi:MAG TPA: hypothetical protein VGL46_14935 [Pseudonocardiaceae bacterium]|jgi:hypothetical protein
MTDEDGPDGDERGVSSGWTPWTAAYAYAAVMRDISMAKMNPEGDRAEFFDVPTMLVAYALAVFAEEEGIVVTRPADLAGLSGMELWERLATPRLMTSLVMMSLDNRAPAPGVGEPGHELFVRMLADLARAVEQDAGQPDEWRKAARRGGRAWYERGEDGQALVAQMLLTYVSVQDQNRGITPLGVIADRAEGAECGPSPIATPDRPYELSEYMAVDEPWPARGTRQWAVRVVQGALSGKNFLMHYLASIRDREIDVPDVLVAPRAAGESAQASAQRERLARLFTETHVQLADHSPEVADELMRIRPSDAPDAVEAITREAVEWWTAAEYDGTISALLPAMTTLLDGLVAPERRGDVQDLLNGTAVDDPALFRAQLRIQGAAQDEPFEALHLAAAFAGALYQIPACVPDPNAACARLATGALQLLQGNVAAPRSAAAAPPRPATSPQKADAKKKAARKTARKSRRQGRR